MRLTRLASLTALVLSVTGAIPLVASAQATATDLYVDNRSAQCSDTAAAAGSQAVPFCTVSAAAKVVQPGQTVHIGPGIYPEEVDLTRSGTPTAPITFVGTLNSSPFAPAYFGGSQIGSGVPHAFNLTGVHDVKLEQFGLLVGTQEPVLVTDSTDITLDRSTVRSALPPSSGGTASPAVRITGRSDQVTVSRTSITGASADAVVVDPGVTHAVITTNLVRGGGLGVSVTDAPGNVITGNTIGWGRGAAIQLAGNSSNSTVENNMLQESSTSPTAWSGRSDLSVSAGSTPGTTADYNVTASGIQSPYIWAGQSYPDIPSFQKASGQGSHDLSDTVGPAPLALNHENSALIDSADASAPGELPTDIFGNPRVDDPLVTNSGTGVGYYDRGAVEFQDPLKPSLSAVTGTTPGRPLDQILNGSVSTPWSAVTQSSVDFGDGSAPVSSPTFPLTHTYPAPGTYTATYSVTDGSGTTRSVTTSATVSIGPIVPAMTVTRVQTTATGPDLPLRVMASTSMTVSPWPIAKETVDFGDGTVVDVADPTATQHDYAAPGTYTVTETVLDDHGRTATTTQSITVGTDYASVTPARILDTRNGLGAPAQQVGPGGVLKLQVTGRGGVPANGKVTAVLLNLTATGATDATHITAFPGGTVPTASNLNITPGHDVGNAVVVPVAPDGTVSLYNHIGNVDLIADVQGYYATELPGQGLRLGVEMMPVRALDTRNGTGKVGPGGTIKVQVRGSGLLPDAAKVAVLNLTATEGTADSYITAAPDGTPPTHSSLNFSAGQTVANQITVPIDPDGTVTLYNHVGSVHLVVDIQNFYFAAGGFPVLTTTPTRLLDTRNGTGGVSGPLVAGGIARVKVSGVAGLPNGISAVVVNLTATNPTDDSWLSVFPSGSPVPATSNLNVTPGATVPNLAVVPVGSDGCIEVYNHSGSTDVVVDLQGYTP